MSELEVCNADNSVSDDQQSVHAPVTNYVTEWVSVLPSSPSISHSPVFINSTSDEDPGKFSGEYDHETETCLHDDDVALPTSFTAGTMLTTSPTLSPINPGPSNIATVSVTDTTQLTTSSISPVVVGALMHLGMISLSGWSIP